MSTPYTIPFVILMAPFFWRRRTDATLPAVLMRRALHRSSSLQKAQAIRMTPGWMVRSFFSAQTAYNPVLATTHAALIIWAHRA